MSKKRPNRKSHEMALNITKAVIQGIADVMIKNSENDPIQRDFIRSMGLLAGHFSKGLLEGAGCEVNYMINGENIAIIKDLDEFGIKERIKLAIEQERYEDAAALKKMLPVTNTSNKKVLYLEAKEVKAIVQDPGNKPE